MSKQPKTPKRAKKTPTEGGPGSRSGTANRRDLGDSDNEVMKLDPELADAIRIEPLVFDEPTIDWTYDEDEKAMTWITDEDRFTDFKLKKRAWFPKVCPP